MNLEVPNMDSCLLATHATRPFSVLYKLHVLDMYHTKEHVATSCSYIDADVLLMLPHADGPS